MYEPIPIATSIFAPPFADRADLDSSNTVGEHAAGAVKVRTSGRLAFLPAVDLLGARIHSITEEECIEAVMNELADGRGGSVYTVNLDHLRRFVFDPANATNYDAASIITADGTPLIWASHLQGTPLPERVTGSNLIWSLTAAAAERGRSIYLLGGNPGTAERTAQVLTRLCPKLKIAGRSSDNIDLRMKNEAYRKLIRSIAAAKPDIVYVALGSPKQEDLIEQLRSELPDIWWLGVGIAFSFVAGEIRRAPLWMQRMGLEWLHRLWQEPKRLAKRYLVQGLPFLLTLFASAISRRLFPNSDVRYP